MKGRIAGAVVLALVASEVLLRLKGLPKKHDQPGSCDPMMTEPDARNGWLWRASYALDRDQGGRVIPFAFDADHDRAPSTTWTADRAAPSILFAGESIVEGHALLWDETIPAIVGGALGIQTVNLGVQGYGSDQAFVRLADALPRFQHPVAVVSLFFPGMVDRVAWVDRPRLAFDGDALRVTPAGPTWWQDLRLTRTARELAPWHDADAVALTARVFAATERMARARGATAITLVTYPEGTLSDGDRALVDRVVGGTRVVERSYVPIPGDGHPDAPSARRLAEAVVEALRDARVR
ncbi:MAG TPA: hypothetical protein VGG39_35445 [Polyangiaceae bacterium]|jgi:hypothetical protein